MSTERTSFSAIKALVLIVLTTILGCVGVYTLSNVFEFQFPGGEWQPVQLGQENATRILGIASEPSPGIYIQTDQDKIYACTDKQGELFGSFTFVCASASAPQALQAPYSDVRYTPPPPPGEVHTSFVGSGVYAKYCSGQTNFVILKDGTVWSWSKVGCCEAGCLLNLIYPVGGMMLGFVVGIVIVIIQHRRHKANRKT